MLRYGCPSCRRYVGPRPAQRGKFGLGGDPRGRVGRSVAASGVLETVKRPAPSAATTIPAAASHSADRNPIASATSPPTAAPTTTAARLKDRMVAFVRASNRSGGDRLPVGHFDRDGRESGSG